MRRIRPSLSRLHSDERGLKTLEVVALLAVSMIILLVIKLFWYRIQNWFVGNAAPVDEGWDQQPAGDAPGES